MAIFVGAAVLCKVPTKEMFHELPSNYQRVDGLAQWLERWTGDPKVEGSNPVRSTRKTFLSQKGCADSLSVCPTPHVHTHAYERPCTHVKDPIVHVRVRWIMKTRK